MLAKSSQAPLETKVVTLCVLVGNELIVLFVDAVICQMNVAVPL